MITLFSWPTPNGHKVHIMLEECGLPYRVSPVDITKGEQFAPGFTDRISPNAKIPAIVDEDAAGGPLSLFESGAILLYLAEKSGCFLPKGDYGRWSVMQWLMWQVGGLGPMLGQAQHFHRYAPEAVPYAQERYRREGHRLMGVLDTALSQRAFLAGRDYTIADIATFPWVRINALTGVAMEPYQHVTRWYGEIRARPAVGRGLDLLRDRWVDVSKSDEAKRNMFGAHP